MRARFLLLLVLGYPKQVYGQLGPTGQEGWMSILWGVNLYQAYTARIASFHSVFFTRSNVGHILNPVLRTGVSSTLHEVLFKVAPKWNIHQGIAYFYRPWYDNYPPYEPEDPSFRHEIRTVIRFVFNSNPRGSGVNVQCRPEARFYLNPNGSRWRIPFEARLRVQVRGRIWLEPAQRNALLLGHELFFSTQNTRWNSSRAQDWTRPILSELRSGLYYRRTFLQNRYQFSVGIGHILVPRNGFRAFFSAYTLIFDLLLVNPFRKSPGTSGSTPILPRK